MLSREQLQSLLIQAVQLGTAWQPTRAHLEGARNGISSGLEEIEAAFNLIKDYSGGS